MRIAIDARRTTVARVTGTEHYALALIRALIQQNQAHELTLYFRDTPPADLFPSSARVTYRIIPFPRLWTHLRFAAALWHDRPDLTFVPAHTLPFCFPGKAIVTAHDLGYRLFPEAHPRAQRFYLDLTTRYSARRAHIVLADSQATANDLRRYYNVAPEKIRVIYPGVEKPQLSSNSIGAHDSVAATQTTVAGTPPVATSGEGVTTVHEKLEKSPLRLRGGDLGEGSNENDRSITNNTLTAKYNLPQRYFLFIGTLQPRKNIARIAQAYARYRGLTEDPAALVLAGGKGWLYDDNWVEGIEGIHLPGYIDEADKGALMAGALALVFPTLYEGFGFPVIEAMHCGAPVIGSNTSSLPELIGEAGIQVDPLDVDAIAAAMTRLDVDGILREQLRARGYLQAEQFTWENAARQFWGIVDTLLKNP